MWGDQNVSRVKNAMDCSLQGWYQLRLFVNSVLSHWVTWERTRKEPTLFPSKTHSPKQSTGSGPKEYKLKRLPSIYKADIFTYEHLTEFYWILIPVLTTCKFMLKRKIHFPLYLAMETTICRKKKKPSILIVQKVGSSPDLVNITTSGKT